MLRAHALAPSWTIFLIFERVGNVVGSRIVIIAVSLLGARECVCLSWQTFGVFCVFLFFLCSRHLFLMLLHLCFGGQTAAEASGQIYGTVREKACYPYDISVRISYDGFCKSLKLPRWMPPQARLRCLELPGSCILTALLPGRPARYVLSLPTALFLHHLSQRRLFYWPAVLAPFVIAKTLWGLPWYVNSRSLLRYVGPTVFPRKESVRFE